METYGTVNPDEASAALAAARQSRARVAWAVLIIAGAAGSKFAPWPPIAAAVLVFLLFAGTGLTLSARAARR